MYRQGPIDEQPQLLAGAALHPGQEHVDKDDILRDHEAHGDEVDDVHRKIFPDVLHHLHPHSWRLDDDMGLGPGLWRHLNWSGQWWQAKARWRPGRCGPEKDMWV